MKASINISDRILKGIIVNWKSTQDVWCDNHPPTGAVDYRAPQVCRSVDADIFFFITDLSIMFIVVYLNGPCSLQ